jgi:hypothetical protein
MKKSLVLGIALTMSLNSLALASGDRVHEIVMQTEMARAQDRAVLVEDLETLETKVRALRDQLQDVQGKVWQDTGAVTGSIVFAVGAVYITSVLDGASRLSTRYQGIITVAGLSMLSLTILGSYLTLADGKTLILDMNQMSSLRDLVNRTLQEIADTKEQLSQ